MGGFNDPGDNGVGFGLINVEIGELEYEYISHPNIYFEDYFEGGGFQMTYDPQANIVYSTLYAREEPDQPPGPGVPKASGRAGPVRFAHCLREKPA